MDVKPGNAIAEAEQPLYAQDTGGDLDARSDARNLCVRCNTTREPTRAVSRGVRSKHALIVASAATLARVGRAAETVSPDALLV